MNKIRLAISVIALINGQPAGKHPLALHLMDIRNMSLSETKVTFRMRDALKTLRPGDHLSELVFDAYVLHRRICEYTTIVTDLERKKERRGIITIFFLTAKPPIKPASRDTLRRWTEDIMKAAGID